MAKLKIISDEPLRGTGVSTDNEDAFNHNAFAQTIFRVIEDNDPPLTFGLFGGWGVGKSSIINLLEHKCKENSQEYSYVFFNAWAYSGDSLRRQLLIALAKGLIKDPPKLKSHLDLLRKLNYAQALEESSGHTLKELWDKARGAGLCTAIKTELRTAFENVKLAQQGVVGLTISGVLGIIGLSLLFFGDIQIKQWGAAILFLGGANLLFPKVENIFVLKRREVFDARLIFPEQFEEHYEELVQNYASDVKKIIVVIDDLDRCDAETIKTVLVTLKNFMGKGKSIFIVPMDDSAVVRMFRGENTNFGYEQLRKYFSVSLRIPAIHSGDLLDYARKISNEYQIPPKIAFIAAQGHCRDARKMKHFLNLYKIKYALAEERAQQGYLRGIDLDQISEQLAKVVILEYQYPEFFRFISMYPNTLLRFSNASRGAEEKDLEEYPLKDIGENHNSQISNLEGVWRTQPGLREFLRATYDVVIDDFELISTLKTTNQEHAVGEFGIDVKNAIQSGSDIDLEKYFNSLYVNKHGRSIVDVLSRYFVPDLPTPTKTAITFALDLVRRELLDPDLQRDLLRRTIEILTHKKSTFKMNGKDSSGFLNNIDFISDNQRRAVTERILNDVFVDEHYDPEFSKVLGHTEFKHALEVNNLRADKVDEIMQTWYTKLTSIAEKQTFVDGIQAIMLNREDRLQMGLLVPSNKLLALLTKSLMTDVPHLNTSIVDVVLNKNYPEEFDGDVIGLETKLVETIEQTISTPSSENLKLALRGLCKMPHWLTSDNANKIGRLVIAAHPTSIDGKTKETYRDVILMCIWSPSVTVAVQDQFKHGFYDILRSFDPSSLEQELERIKRLPSVHDIALKEKFNKEIIADRWSMFINTVKDPTDTTLGEARFFRKHIRDLKSGDYDVFLQTLLSFTDSDLPHRWSQFIAEEVGNEMHTGASIIMDSLLTRLSNKNLDNECRTVYGGILVEIITKNQPVDFGMPYYSKIFDLLSDEDTTSVAFATHNFRKLDERFGKTIPENQTTLGIKELLSRSKMSSYKDTIEIYLRFKQSVEKDTWSKIVDRIIEELPNESLDVNHRWCLLLLGSGIPDAGLQSARLSEALFLYKENGKVDELKSKAYELYDLLTSLKIVVPFVPNPESASPIITT